MATRQRGSDKIVKLSRVNQVYKSIFEGDVIRKKI